MDRKIFFGTKRYFDSHPKALSLLKFIYKVLPNLMFIAYPIMLAVTYFTRGFGSVWLQLVFVPFFVLVLVTVLRLVINEPRPYEAFGVPSAFEKKTVGKSMPSRHTASAFVIAMAFLRVNIPLGIVALVFSLLIMASRVLAGAHYVRDVAVGAAIAAAAGMIFFVL